MLTWTLSWLKRFLLSCELPSLNQSNSPIDVTRLDSREDSLTKPNSNSRSSLLKAFDLPTELTIHDNPLMKKAFFQNIIEFGFFSDYTKRRNSNIYISNIWDIFFPLVQLVEMDNLGSSIFQTISFARESTIYPNKKVINK